MRAKEISAVAIALALVVSACAGQGEDEDVDSAPDTDAVNGEEGEAGFDWKKFDGESLTVLMVQHPWTDAMEDDLQEFEDLTGISVAVESFAEELYFDQMTRTIRGDEGVADAYMVPMDSTAFNQWEADLITPLTPYIEDEAATSTDYDFDDFPAELVSVSEFPPGSPDAEAHAIPITSEVYILFYNEELVNEYLNGELPDTMAGLVQAAEEITEQGGGEVFGAVGRGLRSATLMDTMTGVVLNSWGTDEAALPYNVWFDGAWDAPRLDDPRNVEGVENYARLVASGPPNALSLDWPDATTLFSQGRAAFMVDASLFGPGFEDPSASEVAGNVGYAVLPETEAGSATGHWMWGLGIPANSPKQDAAWLFLQWATNGENTAEFGASTGGAPRLSAYDDPAYTDALVPEYTAIVSEALEIARPTVVFTEGWEDGALVIVDAMQAIAEGEDPESVMAEANERMRTTITP